MGCDIHCYYEVLINGEWLFFGMAQEWRNYTVFARINGVRGDTEEDQIYTPYKEMPVDDLSGAVERIHERWQGDAHSYFVMSYEDMQTFVKRWGVPVKYVKGDWQEKHIRAGFVENWLEVSKQVIKIPVIEDIRVVGWYDN